MKTFKIDNLYNKLKFNYFSNVIFSRNITSGINFCKFPLRKFCEWKRVEIPFEKLEINFTRSSGPGGQNVNKLNTKVEYRFHVDSADWIDKNCKDRLKELYHQKINNEGYFILTCQEYRTQSQNKKEAMKKLQEIIYVSSIPKKERIIIPFEETPEMEEKRIKEKKKRSDIKKLRNNNNYNF